MSSVANTGIARMVGSAHGVVHEGTALSHGSVKPTSTTSTRHCAATP